MMEGKMADQRLGWRSDCQSNFDKGLTVNVLCKADDPGTGAGFLYRVILRKRGFAKGRVII